MKKNIRIVTAVILCLSLFSLSFETTRKKIRIFSIGDSTMATYDQTYLNSFGSDYPLRGWMQMIQPFLNQDAEVKNYAVSGRSSKSFRAEGHWDKVMQQLKEGDYVFIQFGHNDEKQADSTRYTEPRSSFRQNLLDYISEVKAQKAIPVLFTSIPRRTFDQNGKITDTHGEYVSIIPAIAQEAGIAYIDLNKAVTTWLEQIGPEQSIPYFMHIPAGKYAKLPDGKKDDTHLSIAGAEKIAGLAAQELKKLGGPVSGYIK